MASAARAERSCPRCGKAFADASFCPIDGAQLEPHGEPAPDSDPYIGTVIHGDIELRAVAGAGAMGRVYRAYQRGIDRDVAVKILHRELSGNASLMQRFHREAKIASKLQHPHVVEVYLAGQLPDGALFIVMEFLDGMSLAAALGGGVLPLDRALSIALQICDAVGEGHARGIVHRDMKPENVMLVRRADTADWVKVLDFGIAKVNIGEQSMETAAGLIFGTARYISPEGAQGTTVGPTGDVYSIAVMLYQLLSGHTPFDAEQPVGMLIKHIHDAPPALRSWPAAANLPEPIVRVVMDNLAKTPAQRAPSARALGNAIAAAAKEANIVLADVGVVARMSLLDLGQPRSFVEPTLDDAAAAPGIAAIPAPPLTSGAAAAVARTVSDLGVLADTAADVRPPSEITGRPTPAAPPSPRTRRGPGIVIGLAFMLGVALTALVMQYVAQRPDREHAAYIQRARRALSDSRFVEPPGDNVRDLVRTGLARWPDDPDLLRVQSEAAHEIVTAAMAARSGGDVAGARDLAKTAHELDTGDGTARLLFAQYEDELASAADAGLLGGVRVTLDVPIGRARPGGRAELVARITTGTAPREAASAQFVVSGPGLAADGITLPAVGSGPYTAIFSPPREGNYTVEFEANVEGATVRANRMLHVSR